MHCNKCISPYSLGYKNGAFLGQKISSNTDSISIDSSQENLDIQKSLDHVDVLNILRFFTSGCLPNSSVALC